eukprot:scaffold393550_cov51-Prasinocladus_malaysianus.AAC.1
MKTWKRHLHHTTEVSEASQANEAFRNSKASSSQKDNNLTYVLRVFNLSLLGAFLIKYGERALDAPFEDSPLVPALVCILIPTALNMSTWAALSASEQVQDAN